MPLVLEATRELLHMLVSKSTKPPKLTAMLNNKATNAKLESANS